MVLPNSRAILSNLGSNLDFAPHFWRSSGLALRNAHRSPRSFCSSMGQGYPGSGFGDTRLNFSSGVTTGMLSAKA